MGRWSNWSGKQQVEAERLHFAKSIEDVQGLVRNTTGPIRVAGTGHSHYRLVPTTSTIVDLSPMAGVIEADTENKLARAWAGTKIKSMAHALHAVGLGFHNQGDIDEQAIAGATATGTHGSGLGLRSFSAALRSARIVTAAGEVIEVSEGENPELFKASQLSLGALGVMLDQTLEVRDAYRLEESGWSTDFETLRPQIAELTKNHRHFEFFMTTKDGSVVAKTIDETSKPAEYPMAEEGGRVGWSHEVLSNFRSWRHSEMEFAVPLEDGLDCLEEVAKIVHPETPELTGPIQYRTLGADDVWMSTAYGRDTATISVHFDARGDDEPYYRQCEEVFRHFGGRPHWAKVHYLSGEELAAVHPRWSDWVQARATIDPDGRFLNAALRDLFQ